MAARVVFIDTSVLLNVLKVPHTGNAEDQEADREKFAALHDQGVQLVLPVTTIIETGNAIASIDGEKHQLIQVFVSFLRATLTGDAPWVAAGFSSTSALLRELLDDAPAPLDSLMNSKVGTGDAAILAEVAELRRRLPTGMPVEIWTRDKGLSAYS